jgi:hypothetical protein
VQDVVNSVVKKQLSHERVIHLVWNTLEHDIHPLDGLHHHQPVVFPSTCSGRPHTAKARGEAGGRAPLLLREHRRPLVGQDLGVADDALLGDPACIIQTAALPARYDGTRGETAAAVLAMLSGGGGCLDHRTAHL